MVLRKQIEMKIDDGCPPIAMITLSPTGLNFFWFPGLFANGPLPSEVRHELVELLRFHADRLEDGGLDKQMQRAMAGEDAEA